MPERRRAPDYRDVRRNRRRIDAFEPNRVLARSICWGFARSSSGVGGLPKPIASSAAGFYHRRRCRSARITDIGRRLIGPNLLGERWLVAPARPVDQRNSQVGKISAAIYPPHLTAALPGPRTSWTEYVRRFVAELTDLSARALRSFANCAAQVKLIEGRGRSLKLRCSADRTPPLSADMQALFNRGCGQASLQVNGSTAQADILRA